MPTIQALAAPKAGAPLEPFSYDPGPLGPEDVEVAVEFCGICHSDLSMQNNDWGITQYPFVPGHEVVGRVAARGERVSRLAVGQRVGLGWYARSCRSCPQCLGGDQNLCPTAEGTIVGRHGGFAQRVRAHEGWTIALPEALDASKAGPLFCGGITVFNPILQAGVTGLSRVAVVGIGGLGHLALQFLRAWGCHVTAFTSTAAKADEARAMGAHDVVATRDEGALGKLAGTFDMILVTVNVALDWDAYVAALAPRGTLHFVGVVPPATLSVFPLIGGQKKVGGTPLGSPLATAKMLEFCARHAIAPVTEHFPMSRANEALEHLHAGKARYRIVLENDLG